MYELDVRRFFIVRHLCKKMPDSYTVIEPHSDLLVEADVQNNARLNASKNGAALWRNNNGAFRAPDGRWVRYGLANDSSAVNKVFKSSDLIGVTPVMITPEHVGHLVGVFTAVECKAPGWQYRDGDARAEAQLAFIKKIISLGGIAYFLTTEGGK